MCRIIDTHAYLDELANLNSTLADVRRVGVVALIAVGCGQQSNMKTLEISRDHRRLVCPAFGLHPWQLAGLGVPGIGDSMRWIEDNLLSAVALSAIGLDYDKRVVKGGSREMQKEVLGRLPKTARRHAKPAIIHSRYAWKDALLLVQETGIDKAVFHWFTGFPRVLKDIIADGFRVSATPAAEYHEEHRRAVREAPLHRLRLETDCPVTHGRTARYEARPADILRSLEAVSSIKGGAQATIAEQTTINASELFSLGVAF